MSRFASNSARRRRAGSVALDFGMTGAIFCTAVIACVDIGRYVATRTALGAAVSEVTRAAMVNPALTGCADPETLALARVAMMDPALLTICVTRPAPAPGAQATVAVNASYTFSFITPLFGTPLRTLTANATSPI